MNVKKQDYMLEALGQLDDKFIEEAVTYKKPKLSFLQKKEWGALAACVAIMVLATVAYQYMPVRSTEEATAEYTEGDLAQEGTYSYGVIFVPATEEGTVEEFTEDKQKDGVATNELCAYPTVESLQEQKGAIIEVQKEADTDAQSSANYSITSAKSRAEILDAATDAFKGTVTAKKAYETGGAIQTVFTILTVQVDEVLKGDTEVGKTYTIYIPVGVGDTLATDNSLSGDLLEIEVGTKGTFIPQKTSATTGQGTTGTAEAYLSYADVAEYYILNGVEHFILEEK